MRRHAQALGVAVGLALLAGLAALPLAPHPLAKEGPIEHASHAVLGLSALAWTIAAAWITERRLVALALALIALVLLLEETDWLGLYGLEDGARALRAGLGRPNLHTAGAGRGYPFFVVPLVLFFTAPHLPRVGPRARALLGPTAPSREVALAFGVAFVALAATQLLPIDPRDRFEEGAELALYATLGLGAWETIAR